MRPQAFDRFYGQEHLLGPGRILTELIESGQLVSIIFWGPPGSGKTTLGMMLAKHFGLNCLFLVQSCPALRKSRKSWLRPSSRKNMYGQPIIIFIDEIHRFNKAQQSAFLPYVERGDVILFGSTTENPSFEVIAPLLSRTRVLVLKPLDQEALRKIINDALTDEINGLGRLHLRISEEALALLYDQSNGDARRALNALEIAASLTRSQEITVKEIEEALQKRMLIYDKSGEEHFNLISALHKSLRNSDVDASLYWLARCMKARSPGKF